MKSVRVLRTMVAAAWRWGDRDNNQGSQDISWDLLRLRLSGRETGENIPGMHNTLMQGNFSRNHPSGRAFPGGGSCGPSQKQLTLRVLD